MIIASTSMLKSGCPVELKPSCLMPPVKVPQDQERLADMSNKHAVSQNMACGWLLNFKNEFDLQLTSTDCNKTVFSTTGTYRLLLFSRLRPVAQGCARVAPGCARVAVCFPCAIGMILLHALRIGARSESVAEFRIIAYFRLQRPLLIEPWLKQQTGGINVQPF